MTFYHHFSFHPPFLFPSFLGGKRKGEKNNQSRSKKSCLYARYLIRSDFNKQKKSMIFKHRNDLLWPWMNFEVKLFCFIIHSYFEVKVCTKLDKFSEKVKHANGYLQHNNLDIDGDFFNEPWIQLTSLYVLI